MLQTEQADGLPQPADGNEPTRPPAPGLDDATEAGGTNHGRSGETRLKISSRVSHHEQLTLAVVIHTPSLIYPADSSVFLKVVYVGSFFVAVNNSCKSGTTLWLPCLFLPSRAG